MSSIETYNEIGTVLKNILFLLEVPQHMYNMHYEESMPTPTYLLIRTPVTYFVTLLQQLIHPCLATYSPDLATIWSMMLYISLVDAYSIRPYRVQNCNFREMHHCCYSDQYKDDLRGPLDCISVFMVCPGQ